MGKTCGVTFELVRFHGAGAGAVYVRARFYPHQWVLYNFKCASHHLTSKMMYDVHHFTSQKLTPFPPGQQAELQRVLLHDEQEASVLGGQL